MINIYIILCIVLSFILAFIFGCMFMWYQLQNALKETTVKNEIPTRYDYYNYARRSSSHIDRYPLPKGESVITKNQRQKEIGIISKLMTNMIKKNASEFSLINVTNYSRVVIDAIKYKLDYKKAYEDYGIAGLKKAYLK